MKKSEAAELFNILKDLKLSGMDTSDRMTIIRNIRSFREVAERYAEDIELAKDRLKPDGYDDLVMKMLESNESVAAGNGRTATDAEIASFNRMNELYNREMRAFRVGVFNAESQCFEGGIDSEYSEVNIETVNTSAFDKLMDLNKDLPAGKLSMLYGNYSAIIQI